MNETTTPASTPCPNCKGRGGWDEPEDCIVCEVCGGSGRVRNDTSTPPAPSAGSGPENPAVEHIRDALAYVRPLLFVISEDSGEPPWRRAKADRAIAKLDAAMLAMDGLSNTERSGGGQ